MKIGNFRHRIQLQTLTETQDANFSTLRIFTTLATVSAEILIVKGSDVFQMQQVNEVVTHKFRIRFNFSLPQITAQHWILMNSRRFRIRKVENLFEKNRVLVLFCEEYLHDQNNFTADANAVEDALISDLPPET